MAIAEDRRRMAVRITALQAVVFVAFALLVGGFWFFQIAQHQKFKELAENNHQRTLALRAPRGIIFDRQGRVLVENRNAFNISILREHTKDIGRTIQALSNVTGVPEAEMRLIVEKHKGEPSYRPIVVIQDATLAQVAAVTARRLELSEVIIQEVPTRQYPSESLAAHLIGYVGEASEDQVTDGGFSLGSIVGQFGVEKIYNRYLMGEDGARRVVVNSTGREIRELNMQPPVEGQRVQLTLDLALQKAAEDGFRQLGFNGAAVVIDPNTGDVVTLVSLPAFDPNAFAGGIDHPTWNALNTDKLRPLQNRAIQGRYSPGSTFKLVVAAAALEEGLVTPSFRVNCGGGASFYGRYFQCWNKNGHGSIDMRHAIEQSCNVYFYTLGNMLGVDKIHKSAVNLGLAGKSGIDLPNEIESLVPSTEWKQKTLGDKWYAGETISVAIGQGYNSVTPMSLAVMMATLANGGTRRIPRLVKAVDDGSGWKELPPPDNPFPTTRFKAETTKAIHDGLWLAVNGAGTAGRGKIVGRDVSGKTGTAQPNMSLENQRRLAGLREAKDHGWFVFMVPRDNPVLAGVIFAEHAEHGYFAAPIARHIIQTYYAEKEGRPLPEFIPNPLITPDPPPGVRAAGNAVASGSTLPAPAPAPTTPAPTPTPRVSGGGGR